MLRLGRTLAILICYYIHMEDEVSKGSKDKVVFMHVKILGPMTKSVELLLQNTAMAFKKLKLHATFERVSEFRKVASYGIATFPALVIDEKLVAVGTVLEVDEVADLIRALH